MAEARLAPLSRELARLDAIVEPVVYADDHIGEVRDQLLRLDGVLVWVNPVQDGADRSRLDALLREVAGQGVWVSAHPEVILQMGTKEVLHTTRSLGWGSDTALYRSQRDFAQRFPARLGARRVLVLKQGRGTAGAGVWKVELADPSDDHQPAALDAVVRVQHAQTRDTTTEELALGEFLQRCRGYFSWSGLLVDQPFQERLADGLTRAYLVHDQVVGFCHQWPAGLLGPGVSADGQPGAHVMEDPEAPAYQLLRKSLESEWIPQMRSLLGLDAAALPVIWDADFLYGPETDTGADSYVLCEVNVSCVWPYPEQAAASIAHAALDRIRYTMAAREANPPSGA